MRVEGWCNTSPPDCRRWRTRSACIPNCSPARGLLATAPREWGEAVRELANDPALRRELGRRGRERVEADYSVARAVELWGAAFGVRPARV